MRDGFVVVASFWHVLEARMASSFLASEGVEVDVTDEGIAGVNPFLAPVVGGVRLLVAAKDAERARTLLQQRGLAGGAAPAGAPDSHSLEDEAMSSEPADESVGDFLKRKK